VNPNSLWQAKEAKLKNLKRLYFIPFIQTAGKDKIIAVEIDWWLQGLIIRG
jgi:hypothetical protein